MIVALKTRQKQSSHESNYNDRNKVGVDEFGVEWITMQERVLQSVDVVFDRTGRPEEIAVIKDLVSAIAYVMLKSKKK